MKRTHCSLCGAAGEKFKHGRCRECMNAYHREWRAKNRAAHRASVDKYRASEKGQVTNRARYLETKYALSIADFDRMLADQRGLCALCHHSLGEDIAIDHSHETGAVRGLLHRNCNAALGLFKDDPLIAQRAAVYLHHSHPKSLIHPWALIGEPAEHRSHVGAGIYPEIDPTAKIEAFATVDAGIHEPTRIGARSWAMKKSHIGHDAQIGHDVEIAPLCSIGGHVEIGDWVRIGQGATFKPFVRVGAGARVGMGSVVICDVPAGEVWAGNPARCIHKATERMMTDSEVEGWEEWWAASRA